MGSEIAILISDLRNSATVLDSKITEFSKAYSDIYTAVSDLKISYKGQSSDAFVKKIESYRETLKKAEDMLKGYVNDMREYADTAEKKEQENVNNVNKLP